MCIYFSMVRYNPLFSLKFKFTVFILICSTFSIHTHKNITFNAEVQTNPTYIFFSQKSDEDLELILQYYSQFEEKTGEKYIINIISEIERLLQNNI